MTDKPLPWIQVASDLRQNDKFKAFLCRCGLDHLQAFGALISLWIWFARRYPTGRAPKKKFDIVAILEIDEEKAVKVFRAMQRVGMVEVNDDEISLHDWSDFAGKAIQQRDRWRRYRQSHSLGKKEKATSLRGVESGKATLLCDEEQESDVAIEVESGKATLLCDEENLTDESNVAKGGSATKSDVRATRFCPQTTKTTTDNNKSLKEKETPDLDPDPVKQPDFSPEDSASNPPAACSSSIGESGNWGIRETEQSLRLLISCGISPETAAHYATTYHPNRIIRQVNQFASRRAVLANPTGYLLCAIEKDYR